MYQMHDHKCMDNRDTETAFIDAQKNELVLILLSIRSVYATQ